MSTKIKTPILNKAVKERAAKKLKQGKASKAPAVTGSIVQPIHISKNDPIVRKMLGHV
ncbi:hypothetical protein [Peribacillus saganii]|uniref:hypothetical protein n=1 Tax=Peribacillus saganii TaxID=2303992 RepID=UPI001314C146|nr:hypothetical protein [Peribacillus saganii]